MPKSKIPSPARSQGATTPKRKKFRGSRSLCSPALSTASGRLTSLVDQFKDKNMESFALSPLNRRSILNDDTAIEEPRRKSWWKKLKEDSHEIMEVLEEDKVTDNKAIEELVDIEVLSQEKKDYTLDLPESSDNESINSIVLPQRKLFTQKENKQQKKFGQFSDNRETLAKLHKTNTNVDKTVNVGTRELFQNAKRSKPIFPAALLNISPNKTTADKTKENILPEPKVRNIFGNRPANKRKNMFADFVVSESEDEIPEIQPRVFGFQKKLEQRRISSISKGREGSPASSITTDMEMDDWKLLPSSTMVENQLEDIVTGHGHTPKRARLSKLSEAKESEAGTNTLQTNTTGDKTKTSNKSVTSKNKSKSSPDLKDKSLNNSRLTRSMMKNASKLEEKTDPSKQDTKTNKSQSKISSKELDTTKEGKRQNTIVVEKDSQAADVNKSKSNKSVQKETKQAKTVEESVESQNEQSANDNVDGNEMQEAQVEQNHKSQDAEKVSEDLNEKTNNSKENDERNITEDDAGQENEVEMNVSQGNDDEENANSHTDEINVSKGDDENESEGNEENIEEDDANESTKHEEPNKSLEVEAEVDESEEIEEQDESQEIENEINESQEVNEEADDSKVEENASEDENNEDENESQEVDHEEEENVEESQEVDNEEDNQEENDDENQGVDNHEISQEVENNEVSEQVENDEVSQEIETDNTGQEIENDDEQVEKDDENEVENDERNEEVENDERNEEVNNVIENAEVESDEEGEEENVDASQEMEQEIENQDDNNEESKEIEQEVENEDENEDESQEVENEDEIEEEEIEESQVVENDEEDQEIESEAEVNESQEIEDDQEEENENESEELKYDDEDEEEQNKESQEVENDEEDQVESEAEVNESQEIEDDQEMEDSDEADRAIASDPDISDQDDNDADEMEVDDDDNNEQESENEEEIEEDQEESQEQEPSAEEIEESPNVTHDTTGRHRQKQLKSPEAVLHEKTNQMDSFTAKGRNTSIRKTKSMIKNLNIRPSLAPQRDSLAFSDGTRDSSAEGSGWDSHRTTRKTLRQTFGKDFTPRKSLRALVMEKSAKRQTEHIDLHSETAKYPQANSTELPEYSNGHVEDFVESDHEVSRRTRQTTLETYLQKIKQQNIENKVKMEELVRNSLKAPARDTLSLFKVPNKPAPRRAKLTQNKPRSQIKSVTAFGGLPTEVIEDMKYKPPKRFQPTNASWITKRLYKFLETKLEPKYDYKARVRAEKLVETIYHFAKDLRRHDVAPTDAVDVLKHELARLEVVQTHFEFYEFFHEFMPREVRVKVVPDIVNKIALPRHGVFSDILRGNTVQG